jgi:uncharacterized membrane protein YkoI
MTPKRIFMLFTSSFVMLLAIGIANCQETPVKFKDLPPAVQETAKTESRGTTVKGYAKEMDGGKIEYEVQLDVNGRARDVSIDPSGKVIETESEVDFTSVPEKAREAIQKEAAGAKIEKVEKVKSDGSTVYEALIHTGGKKNEIRVLENGEKAPTED